MSNNPSLPPRPRRGRPRLEDAGEVDQRILEAATAVILQHGYARATMEQVAEAARASKTTLYNRYPTKAALFQAVVKQPGGALPFPADAAFRAGTMFERLVRAGKVVADVTLTRSSIALMRATLAESDTFPDVAKEGFQVGFDACARHVARALSESDDETAVFDVMPVSRRFVEIALHPLYMHAFYGADLEHLRQRADEEIPALAGAFLAAQR